MKYELDQLKEILDKMVEYVDPVRKFAHLQDLQNMMQS